MVLFPVSSHAGRVCKPSPICLSSKLTETEKVYITYQESVIGE